MSDTYNEIQKLKNEMYSLEELADTLDRRARMTRRTSSFTSKVSYEVDYEMLHKAFKMREQARDIKRQISELSKTL